MPGPALERGERLRRTVAQHHVADIDVRFHGRIVHVGQEAIHLGNVVDERHVERLKLNDDLEVAFAGVVAKKSAVFDSEPPLLLRRDDLFLPNVFTDDEQVVFRTKRRTHVEVALAALDVEALNRRVEIHQANAYADHADDRQFEFVAGLLDLGDAVCGLRLHRVLENINTVEAQFLGFPEAIHKANAVLFPSRINHSQFHYAVMLTPNGT